MKRFLIVGAMALGLSAEARADMISGWDVSPKPDGNAICFIHRDYETQDAEKLKVTVTISFGKTDGKTDLGLSFNVSNWDLTKGDVQMADLIIGDTVEFRAAKWQILEKTRMFGFFSNADGLIQQLSQADTIVLRYDGDRTNEGSFDIPQADVAIGAAQICRNQIR